MDFDLDDPLDDILKSDNSSDSFFGSKNAKPASKAAVSSAAAPKDDKSRMSNLFGIKSSQPEEPRQPPPPPPVSVQPKAPEVPRPTPKPTTPKGKENPLRKKEVSFEAEDDDDSMTDLGFDPKKAKAKTNLFDDLLAPTPKVEQKSNPPNRPKTAAAPEQKSIIEDLPPRPKTALRGSPKKTFNDPLGLFAEEKPSSPQKPITKEDSRKGANFDWLGLEKKEEEPVIKPSEPIAEPSRPEKVIESTPLPVRPPVESVPSMVIPLINETPYLEALQRQEYQLNMATQMKQQESVLLDMQHRQKALLQQQEVKFQELIQKQVQRQAHLEGTIRNQQNRINNHLENLINQPMDVLPMGVNESPTVISDKKGGSGSSRDEELIEMQNDVKRLELEKLRFEDLFSNATAIHEQEVTFIEQSHRKQIQLLEDQVKQVEDRLKQENKTLEDFYRNKLDLLETDKREIIEKYEKKLSDLKQDHAGTIENLKTSHHSIMDELKQEHQKAMNHLRESKLMEFSQLEDRFSYLDHLKSAAKYMETATGDLESLKLTINERIETIHKDKEMDLERREKRVEMEQKHLVVVQENAQTEQKRLLELVHSLENKLNSLTKESSEDQWIVRQKFAALEAERSAFEREQFYFREQQKRDEKRMEELKEASLREQTAILEEMNREKEKLADEKIKFATLQKLNETQRPNHKINQHEVEIAIQVAKDAARQSDVERENLISRQRQVELKKREMVELEQQIRRKETELEVMLNAAREREQKAENFVRNAKVLEQKVISKYQQLTRNVQDLVERERKLGEEKQNLSRERMEFQQNRQAANDNRCSLCKTGLVPEKDQVENFNYNDLNVGGIQSGLDLMFSRELNEILKQVPQMDNEVPDYNINYGNKF